MNAYIGNKNDINSQSIAMDSTSLLLLTVRNTNKQYILQSSPILPAVTIFKILSKKLPLPKSIEDFIRRLFSR